MTVTSECVGECEQMRNGLSNILASFMVVALKLPELMRFALPNPLVFYNILCAIPPHVMSFEPSFS